MQIELDFIEIEKLAVDQIVGTMVVEKKNQTEHALEVITNLSTADDTVMVVDDHRVYAYILALNCVRFTYILLDKTIDIEMTTSGEYKKFTYTDPNFYIKKDGDNFWLEINLSRFGATRDFMELINHEWDQEAHPPQYYFPTTDIRGERWVSFKRMKGTWMVSYELACLDTQGFLARRTIEQRTLASFQAELLIIYFLGL